jgi:hypothetical protein
MAFDRVAEVEALLERDDTRVGQYWRWRYRDGRSDAEWMAAKNVSTAPTNAKHTIKSVLTGETPNSWSLADVDAQTIRRWLGKETMSAELRDRLSAQLELLEEIAGGPRKVGLSPRTAKQLEASREAEAQHIHGVYVYTLPHYLKHPVDAESGRTLLKIGHSSRDVLARVAQQRVTALPEDPILVRIYPCDDTASVEAIFHGWLRKAGHQQPTATVQAGNEWFLTSLSFLDDVARQQGLEVRAINLD